MTTITTAVPGVKFSTSGLEVPDESDVLAGRLTDLATALGTDMSRELTTPQGQIATSDTAIIAEKNDQLLAIANSVNPDFASGRWQDAIGRIYFIDRIAAAGTTVTATCTGLVGTQIPAGSQARDNAGYVYASLSDATIPASGAVDVVFQNQTPGAIACPIGDLNTIFRAVNGWSGVVNSAAGIPGNEQENRANFEYRRRESVAQNAKGTAESVYAAIRALPGVLDAYVWSNHSGLTVELGITKYPVPRHSMYAAVYGGKAEDIATVIHNKNQAGCGMAGNTSFTVLDTTQGTNNPPEYTVTWNIPELARTRFSVQLQKNDSMPSDIVEQVQNQIISAFAGNNELVPRARIGAKIFAGGYYSVINQIDTAAVNVLAVTLSLDGINYAPMAEYGVDQVPSLDAGDIEVTMV